MASNSGVIFDLDGVLLDSSAFHLRAWQRLGDELGVGVDEAFFARTFGMTNATILPDLLDRRLTADEAHRLSERKEAVFREEASGRVQLFPGAARLLEELREHGYRLALASSTPASNLAFFSSELNLGGLLDVLVGADDVSRGKPDPEVFLVAASRLGLAPRRCAVVEDAVAGFEAAAAAGMPCVAVATTNPFDRLAERTDVALLVASIDDLDAEDFGRLLGI